MLSQAGQPVGNLRTLAASSGDGARRVDVEPRGECGDAPQQRAIIGREQVVAPADGLAHRAVTIGHARAGGEEPQLLVEAGFQPVEAERHKPGRGQLDGQCHAVQRLAQSGHAYGVRRRDVAGRCGHPRREQVDRIAAAADDRQTRYDVHPLVREE